MADDGMLINFDIGNGSLAIKPTFKGGKWKDRLSAKKAALYNRNKAAKAAERSQLTSSGAKSLFSGEATNLEPPTKKQRLNQQDGSYLSTPKTRNAGSSIRVKRGQSSSASHQVVSSLFTFNPSTQKKDSLPENNEEAEPSNAPLRSELDTFTSLGLSAHLAEHLLTKLEIKAPTAIQRAAVSQLLATDTDAFLQAETGSGKTLAYLLPIVQRIMALSSISATAKDRNVQRDSGLFAIIIAPTRELSKQISVVLESLLRCAHWIVSGTVIGGEKKKSEKARLRKGLNILIATPGRLADHLDHTEVLDVRNVRWLVLDEGDRLMELGFEEDLQKILSKLNFRGGKPPPEVPGLPDRRTTILCSATMKANVERLGEMSLKDAIRIQADPDTNSSNDPQTNLVQEFTAPTQLQQTYAIVPAKQRLVALAAVLRRAFARQENTVAKAIVFISSADSVDFHFEVFTQVLNSTSAPSQIPTPTIGSSTPLLKLTPGTPEIQVHRLHGSLPPATRTATLLSFRTTTSPALLLTTDLSSRGLDLPELSLIIEYDPACDLATHLHRAGRTARAGRTGESLVFLLPGPEEGYATALNQAHGGRIRTTTADRVLERGFSSGFSADLPSLTIPSSSTAKKSPATPSSTAAPGTWQAHATTAQLAIEQHVLGQPRAMTVARAGFRAHVRAYATHVAAERNWFDLQALHLGHLAKAFGLRERPSGLGMEQVGRGKRGAGAAGREKAGRATRRADGQQRDGDGADRHKTEASLDAQTAAEDLRAAARAMHAKARAMGSGGAAEFNLG